MITSYHRQGLTVVRVYPGHSWIITPGGSRILESGGGGGGGEVQP